MAEATAKKKKLKRHASGVKAQRQALRHYRQNQAIKRKIRTEIKNAIQAAKSKDSSKVKELLPQVSASLDKAAQRNVIHWKAAARKKSALARSVETLLAAASSPAAAQPAGQKR